MQTTYAKWRMKFLVRVLIPEMLKKFFGASDKKISAKKGSLRTNESFFGDKAI